VISGGLLLLKQSKEGYEPQVGLSPIKLGCQRIFTTFPWPLNFSETSLYQETQYEDIL